VRRAGFVPCTSRPPDGQSGPTRVAGTSLHSGERGSLAFSRMQAGLLVLHLGSLHNGLCTLPNIGGLHCWSLDSPYTGCQSHPCWFSWVEPARSLAAAKVELVPVWNQSG
jgi:hypothetical protein